MRVQTTSNIKGRGGVYTKSYVVVPKHMHAPMRFSDGMKVWLSVESENLVLILNESRYVDDVMASITACRTRTYGNNKYYVLRLQIPESLARRMNIQAGQEAVFGLEAGAQGGRRILRLLR